MSESNAHSDIDTLKLVLRTMYGEPRDELAWELIKRFGDMRGIFCASSDELCRVPGMTKRVAMFFDAVLPLKRQATLREAGGKKITGQHDAVDFARLYFSSELSPAEIVVCMDGKYNVKDVVKFNLQEDMRELVLCLCRTNAVKFTVMRYSASTFDKLVSERHAAEFVKLKEIGSILGAELIDCIELAGEKAFSLRDGSVKELDDNNYVEYIGQKASKSN